MATRNTGILTKILRRITVNKKNVQIEFNPNGLRTALELGPTEPGDGEAELLTITIHSHLLRCGKQIKLVMGAKPSRSTEPDPRLVNEIVQAGKWFSDLASGRAPTIDQLAKSSGVSAPYVSLKISLAFLSPDIVEMVLAGTQPASLTLERLKKSCPLPASWAEQRAILLA